jgi:acetate kinase
MNRNDWTSFLIEKVELFKSFDKAALVEFASKARDVTFEIDEAVMEFGEEGRFLGVLLDGEAKFSINDDAGRETVLAPLHPGDLFGHGALLTGNKTGANVIGVTRCRALLFSRALFTAEVMTKPEAVQSLARLVTDHAKLLAQHELQSGIRPSRDTGDRDPFDFKRITDTPQLILIINCGSSSLKYRLFDTEKPALQVSGMVERIGSPSPSHRLDDSERIVIDFTGSDHAAAFASMIEALSKRGHIASASDITAVGHRVVHGGERFPHPELITDEAVGEIEQLNSLAPLHNPVNITGIRLARQTFPLASHVAVFDTSYHHTLPSYAYLYGLPYEMYEQHGVRRYGFHGTSHEYVALKAALHLKKPYHSLEIVTCHLGNGASLCAVDHGRSVDTTMGMSPTAGLLMGTRSGDVDPGVFTYLMKAGVLDPSALDTLVNKQSGLLGLSGLSNDMRELETAAALGHGRALTAIKTFCYQIRKFIGAYTAAMQGLDCVVFTGGIGENSAGVRSLACQGLDCMGIVLDEEKNRLAAGLLEPMDIAAPDSTVRVLVIPTNEEKMIARETLVAVERHREQQNLTSQAMREVPIEVSAHHVHLCAEHVALLFGEGHRLTPAMPLSQPGQFACEEKVNLVGPKGKVERVRVLGPERSYSQVEIAMTEQFKLGIHPPIRESGDIANTPGIVLEGPKGSVTLDNGVICAMRHIHLSPEDAIRMGLRDRYLVRVVVKQGDRELTFGDVVVRVHPNFALAMHIDTDEGNAANIGAGAVGIVDGIQSRG